jgi:hypothetical protein
MKYANCKKRWYMDVKKYILLLDKRSRKKQLQSRLNHVNFLLSIFSSGYLNKNKMHAYDIEFHRKG